MIRFIDRVVELLGPFGTVVERPMFGGHGVYLDGLLFALVFDDGLYLKADEINRSEYLLAGWQPFSTRHGRRQATYGFFRVPEDMLETSEHILPWARSAYAAAMRARSKKESAALHRRAKRESALIRAPSEKKRTARRKTHPSQKPRPPSKAKRPRRPTRIRKASARKVRRAGRKRASRRTARH